MKTIATICVLTTTLLGAAACGRPAVPRELASARTAYDRASKSSTATLNPTDLHGAKRTLAAAERSFAENGDTQVTRDLGYAAERKVQTAEAYARAMQATAESKQIVAQMNATMLAQAKKSAADLGVATQQLGEKDKALQSERARLQAEVQRREEAEKRAAQAAADLAKFASVKQETRGTVITLSGAVLFTSGKSELLPSAQLKLAEVAKALAEQDPDSKIVVEGHTDSQGMATRNEELSKKRAEAVRDYLVSRGIASDRITAEGFGPDRPIADNKSPEGRANNRRVEIIVKPAE